MRFGHAPVMAALLLAWPALGGDGDYRTEVDRWRARREADLKADDGWLTLVGLHWLHEGTTRIGSSPASDVLLPPAAPPTLGDLTLDLTPDGDKATLKLAPGVKVTAAGRPFDGGEVRSDAAGRPDILAVGDVRIILLKRGGRHALRVKDNRSPRRASFAGLRWYPVDPSWRVEGRFEPDPSPRKVVLDTIVGEPEAMESAGFVAFERGGKGYRLQAVRSGADKLWLVFRDGTSGRTTHPGARTLTVDAPGPDGRVVLDFNRAINLPCAFSPFATCPLAPRQNRLDLPIAAGERDYEPGPPATPAAGGGH